MAISFPGTPTTAGSTSGTSVTVSKPSGVQDGDYLIACLSASASDAATDFALSGWTRSDVTFTASSATGRVYGIYRKYIASAAAETATSYTFTRGGSSGRNTGIMFIGRGIDATTPVQVKSTGYLPTVAGTTATIAAITATAAGVLLMVNGNEVVSPNADATTASPSGATKIAAGESASGTGSTRTTVEAWYQSVSAGSTGSKAFTWVSVSSPRGDMLVLNPAATNSAPTAAFTHSESDLTSSVDGTGSSDSDGTIASYDWDWGDSTAHGSGSTVSHTYRDAGTYTVTLTVTDNGGATGTATHSVTVTRPSRLRLGTTELSRLSIGGGDAVAIYIGATKVRQLSHTLEEVFADTNVYIAHRGFSATFPEMTMYAYDQAFAWGTKAIEISVWPSADGTFWCTHNQNLSSETGGAFPNNIDTYTDAQLASALVVVPSGTDVSGQTAKPLTKLSDVLAKYGTRQVIFIEDKTYSHASTLVPLLAAVPGYQHRIIWKQDANGNPNGTVAAAGIKTWGYLFSDEMSFFAGQQSKFDYFGLDYNCDDATITSALATAGASRTIAHIIPNQTEATRMLGFGVKGLMSASRSFVPTNPVL